MSTGIPLIPTHPLFPFVSNVYTNKQIDAALFNAFFESRVLLSEMGISIASAYENSRIIGDGSGVGFGPNPISFPFNTTTNPGWSAWNPFGPTPLYQIGTLLQSFMSDTGFPEQIYFTSYGPNDLPVIRGPFSGTMPKLFYDGLKPLPQSKGRRWGRLVKRSNPSVIIDPKRYIRV